MHLFRGHSAPLTCIAFFTGTFTPGSGDIMITGSWDKVTVRPQYLLSLLNPVDNQIVEHRRKCSRPLDLTQYLTSVACYIDKATDIFYGRPL